MKVFLVLLLLEISAIVCNGKDGTTIQADVEDKVETLLKKMNLAQKLGQLQQLDGDRTDFTHLARQGMLGSVLNVRGAERINALMRAANESPLKIPLLFGFDVIHGYRTLFPIPLGETASFDLEAAEKSASIAAEESRSVGVHWTFAPMVDVTRDPRWGRVMEGAGEDSFLVTKMAEARIRGFQGTDYSLDKKVLACAKHFVAYGAPVAGREYNTVDMSERVLRETYLPPFKAAVNAGVGSFMNAFNDLNGVPAVANQWLLKEVLRDEWKFDGLVVSDYNAVLELVNHGLAANASDAARLALNGGTDMEMFSTTYVQHGEQLEKSGKLKIDVIDEAVRNVLRIKYRLKLFDQPLINESMAEATLLKPEFKQTAREISAKSFVLLKNENNTLPISTKKITKLLLVGGLADDGVNGRDWWAGDSRAEEIETILQGISQKVNNSEDPIKLMYTKGCESTCDSRKDFQEAVDAANSTDFAIIVVGETRDLSGEGGSRSNIDLPGFQLELIQRIHAIGKPYVVVVKNGRPLTLEWVAENSPAILITWHAGTMVGPAVVDVLFGDVNPSGKLPMAFPRNVGQIPIYYDVKNTGRPFNSSNPNERGASRYLDTPNTPRYPFGFGLSYTTFKYENLKLEKNEIRESENQMVTVEVENTGTRDGTEVVQLYIRDPVASVTRPLRQLRGFQRVHLKAGEKKSVTFVLKPEDLGFLDKDWKMVVEAGVIQVFVGGSSYADLTTQFTVISEEVISSTSVSTTVLPEQTTQTASTPSFVGALLILTLIFPLMNF